MSPLSSRSASLDPSKSSPHSSKQQNQQRWTRSTMSALAHLHGRTSRKARHAYIIPNPFSKGSICFFYRELVQPYRTGSTEDGAKHVYVGAHAYVKPWLGFVDCRSRSVIHLLPNVSLCYVDDRGGPKAYSCFVDKLIPHTSDTLIMSCHLL
jgi:hypothetical protein